MATEQEKKLAIGIDLGTASLRAAAYREDTGEIEMIPMGNDYQLPAYVGFTESKHIIGSEALRRIVAHPQSTICYTKPLLASGYQNGGHLPDEYRANILPFSYQQSSDPQDPISKVNHKGHVMEFKTASLFAMLLGRVRMKAEAHLGGTVTEVVISVPNNFNTEQRNAILDAAEIAGMTVLHLLPDPCGLLITQTLEMDVGAPGCDELDPPKVLALDIGAGFCNVAYASVTDGIIDVHAMACNFIGGNAMTTRLYNFLVSVAEKRQMQVQDSKAVQRLRKECERAKIALSFNQTYKVELESFVDGRDFVASITREEFCKLCNDFRLSCLRLIDQVMVDGKASKYDLNHVAVSGGSSFMPMLQEDLTRYFYGTRIVFHNYDNAAVRGLAVHAAILAGKTAENEKLERLLLLTVAPMSVSIETVGGVLSKLIPRNVTLPTKRAAYYSWNGDYNMPEMAPPFGELTHKSDMPRKGFIRVYEGNFPEVKDNRLLGTIDISTLLPKEIRPGFRLLITCDIDARNRLTVAIQVENTSKVVHRSLQDTGRLSTREKEELNLRQYEFNKHEIVAELLVELRRDLERRIAIARTNLSWVPAKPLYLDAQIDIIAHWLVDNHDASIQEHKLKNQELEEMERELRQIRMNYESRESGKSVDADGEGAKPASKLTSKGNHVQIEDVSESSDVDQHVHVPVVVASEPVEEHTAIPSERSRAATKLQHADDYLEQAEQLTDQVTNTPPNIDSPKRTLSASNSLSDLQNMGTLFNGNANGNKSYTDSDFDRITTYLRNTGKVSWSQTPRLYTVLRLIDQIDCMDIFLRQGINDMWFPFTLSTLPAALQPSAQSKFIDVQSVAFISSKSFQLENGQQKHAHFSKHDPLPFQVIARLGRGAHGSVDKVMSNFSHKEYARKLFHKSKRLRAEDIRAFRTELQTLRKLKHRHCVSLIATYSDPKYFALIMEPVGEYNLSEYYFRCHNVPDKLSLLRGFYGCLVNAVRYLHNSKVRHRDIKPQNVIVKYEQVYLADFGIAHSWENLTSATTTADSSKTMIYAAPEAVRVERRNTAEDMWSLGCVFLEMATVLKGKTLQDLRDYFRVKSDSASFHENVDNIATWANMLRETNPTGDDVALDWAQSMLQKDPTKRPTAASMHENIVRESIPCRTPFCGECCDGVESTEEEDAGEGNEDVWAD